MSWAAAALSVSGIFFVWVFPVSGQAIASLRAELQDAITEKNEWLVENIFCKWLLFFFSAEISKFRELSDFLNSLKNSSQRDNWQW